MVTGEDGDVDGVNDDVMHLLLGTLFDDAAVGDDGMGNAWHESYRWLCIDDDDGDVELRGHVQPNAYESSTLWWITSNREMCSSNEWWCLGCLGLFWKIFARCGISHFCETSRFFIGAQRLRSNYDATAFGCCKSFRSSGFLHDITWALLVRHLTVASGGKIVSDGNFCP